ncbi:unnamed protein product, partial [Timema podura]|nr:unnamed protein product [Timema podura]
MARAKRATNTSTRNQNCLRRSERIANQRRRRVGQEKARYVSLDRNRRRRRNPSRLKASRVVERTQERMKSEHKHGRTRVSQKFGMKRKNKEEASLDECSLFSINYMKEMLKAGFAEGRRRAEQLVNLALQTGLRS